MSKKLIYILIIHFSFLKTFGQSSTETQGTMREIKMREAVATAPRIDIAPSFVNMASIEQGDIAKRYEPSLLPQLNEKIPGLFSTGRGILGYGVSTGAAGGIRLRGIGGSPTSGILVLINNRPQFMGLMGHPLADAYQSMLAEKVEVIRGPASVMYGSNAMGGVINIITRQPKEDGIKTHLRTAYGSYNTLTSEASTMARKGKFTSVVTASYNRSDNHRKDMGFEQYGGYMKLGYEFSKTWQLLTDLNITHFNASNPGTVSAPLLDNDSRVTRGMASLSLENNYDITSGALNFYYNWGRHKINDGYPEGGTPRDYRFNSKDRMLGISLTQNIRPFKGNRIIVGVDYQHFGGEAWNRFVTDQPKTELADKSENDIAGYVLARQGFGHIFYLNAGIRLDHHSLTGNEWIPQTGFSFMFKKYRELKGTVSKGFRNPTIRELYMFPPQNPDLRPEKLVNYELSWIQHRMRNKLTYSLTAFYINGDNMIQTQPVNGRPQNINTGNVENWGFEADARYQLNSSWTLSGNYSWLRMVHPVTAAPEHKAYAECDYSKGKWSFSTGLQYIHGLYTAVNPDTKENYLLLNVRGSYRLTSFANVFVRGENLLAQQYEINAGFPMSRTTAMGGLNIHF